MANVFFWPLTLGLVCFFILHGSRVKISLKSPSMKISLPYVNPFRKTLRFKLHLNIILPSLKQCGWKIFVGMKIWTLGVGDRGRFQLQSLADGNWPTNPYLPCFFLFTEVKLEKSFISTNIYPDHSMCLSFIQLVLKVWTQRTDFICVLLIEKEECAKCHRYFILKRLITFFFC